MLASIIGFIIASILWWNKTFAKIIDPYLTVLNSLPKVALGPLIIIWIGANNNSIVFMALMISIFVTIINMYQGFMSTEEYFITLLKAFHANKKQIFFKLIVTSNKKNIISDNTKTVLSYKAFDRKQLSELSENNNINIALKTYQIMIETQCFQ